MFMLLMVHLIKLPQFLVSSGASPFIQVHISIMLLSWTWLSGQMHWFGLLVSGILLPGQPTNENKLMIIKDASFKKFTSLLFVTFISLPEQSTPI